MIQINATDIAIITKKPCDYTRVGEEAYLQRIIKFVREEDNGQVFSIRTDMVTYKTVEVPALDEDGNIQLNEDTADIILEQKEKLIWLEQKQQETERLYTNAEIQGFLNAVGHLIPKNITRLEQTRFERQLTLLLQTQKRTQWNTITPDLWENRTNAHLLKDKPKNDE